MLRKCDKWFHDECLGLSESEINNIREFYCAECTERHSMSTKYNLPPQNLPSDKYCHCRKGESDLMIECSKCKDWFHNVCLNMSDSELYQILLYFCVGCCSTNPSLKIIYKDYSKEHTKPLFKKHEILSVYNLYPYHCLLELYKILKFRVPHCLFGLFNLLPNQSGRNLTIKLPSNSLQCQKQTFIYKSTILWNKFHKELLKPSVVTLHNDHTKLLNLESSECTFLDFSTKVATFKSGLRRILLRTQSKGGSIEWSADNYVNI